MASGPQRRDAAARFEASDDLVLRALSPLTLEERLRLATVSKRWQRIVYAELYIKPWNVWRAKTILRRAAGSLRFCRVDVFRSGNTDELVQALCASGAALRTLVMSGQAEHEAGCCGIRVSAEQALQISASCPHLNPSTRLTFSASGAAQAVALLDALPGRHDVWLEPPEQASPVDGGEGRALRVLLRHPRLHALTRHGRPEAMLADGPWLDAALAAVVDALSPQGQREGCSLEHLSVIYGGAAYEGQVAFPDVASVAKAFGQPGQPPPACSLRSFCLQPWAPPSFVRGVLGAARGSLRRLQTTLSAHVVPGTAAGAAVLAAVLERVSSLETLDVGDCTQGEEAIAVLPGLAPLLASPSCRLRALTVDSLNFGGAAGEPDAPIEAVATTFCGFFHALAANRSLRTLKLYDSFLGNEVAILLGVALAARTSQLDSLVVYPICTIAEGLGGILPLVASVRVAHLRIAGIDSGEVVSKAAAQALCVNTALRSLELSQCSASARQSLALLYALETNSKLRSLRWDRPCTDADDGGPVVPVGKSLYHRAAQPLASLLQRNTALRVLDLTAVVSFSSCDLKTIAGAVARNRTLLLLVISIMTSESDSDHAAFVHHMRGNATLRVLCFRESSMSDDAAALLGVELAASAPFLPALRDVALLHSTSYDEEGRGIASELSPLGVAALCAGALTAAPALSLHCAHRCRHSDEAPAVTAAWGSVLAALPPALRKRVQVAERHEGPALVEELVRSVSQSEGDGE